ncbi:MAG: cupin domain-containing protein [Patescibacteria group bacterium]
MKNGNFNSKLKHSQRNGSLINRLGKLGDSKNPIFDFKNIPKIEVRWIRLKKGDTKTVPHKHKVIQTLIILVRGHHEVTINKSKMVPLKKEGDFIFIEPNDLHTWVTKKDTLLMVLRWKI